MKPFAPLPLCLVLTCSSTLSFAVSATGSLNFSPAELEKTPLGLVPFALAHAPHVLPGQLELPPVSRKKEAIKDRFPITRDLMPIIPPDTSRDYKLIVKTPDPTVDYKLIVKNPDHSEPLAEPSKIPKR